MSRRLVLLSLDWIRPKDPRMSLGQASLLARLAGEPDMDVVPLSRAVNAPDFDRRELLSAVLAAASGGALAVGVYVWNEPVVQWLLPELRIAGFTGRILLGGPQLSYAPPGVLGLYPDADAAIRGPGEEALVAWLRDPAATVPGIIVQGGRDQATQARAPLAKLPSPILTGILPIQPFMRWETQRGCIYACAFCQHRAPNARQRPEVLEDARVAAEIEALVNGSARDIAVLDPIFHTNPESVGILSRFAQLGYGGRLSLQARFELVDDAFLDACAPLNVRLEFGLQTIHEVEMRAVRRRNDLALCERVIARLNARKVLFEVSLIYGLPGQTRTSFEASVRWCFDRGVPVVRAFPLMLLRGTGLEVERARWGLVESGDVIPVVVRSDSFDEEDWRGMRRLAADLEVRAEAVMATAG